MCLVFLSYVQFLHSEKLYKTKQDSLAFQVVLLFQIILTFPKIKRKHFTKSISKM